MGLSKKTLVDSDLETETRKWVITGIAIRTSLKPIRTKPRGKDIEEDEKEEEEEEEEEEEGCSTTPTAKESRIPERLPCPPAPRKRRSLSRCNYNTVREFFTAPDLESVFKCYAEKA